MNIDDCSINETYQKFLSTNFAAEKLSISRGGRNNYRLCWVAECKHLYQVFLCISQGKTSSLAASALLPHLDKKQKDCCLRLSMTSTLRSPVSWHGVEFTSTTRTTHTRHLCPITANSITSQLVKNGIYGTTNDESTRLVVREVSQLWRIPTSPD